MSSRILPVVLLSSLASCATTPLESQHATDRVEEHESQDPTDEGEWVDLNEWVMDAADEATSPGPEQEAFNRLVGEWKVKCTMPVHVPDVDDSNRGEDVILIGTASNQALLGGRFLMSSINLDGYEQIWILGFDQRSEQFFRVDLVPEGGFFAEGGDLEGDEIRMKQLAGSSEDGGRAREFRLSPGEDRYVAQTFYQVPGAQGPGTPLALTGTFEFFRQE